MNPRSIADSVLSAIGGNGGGDFHTNREDWLDVVEDVLLPVTNRLALLEAELDGYPTMLEECAARINGMIEVYHDESEGLSEYFAQHGAEHSDENCPQDDTCECPESQKLHKAWARWGHEVTLAYRRLDRIREAMVMLAHKSDERG